MKRWFPAVALLASCSLALSACSGSAQPAAGRGTSSTSTTTTGPPSTPPSSAPPTSVAPSTEVRFAAPVDPQGRPLPGITTSAGGSGSCEPGSDVIGNADVYRCFAGNYVYDPCWAETGGTASGRAVLCQQDPWSRSAVRITLGSPVALTVAKTPAMDDSWGVQLTDGRHCLALQGAHSYFHGAVVNYSCATAGRSPGLALLGHPDRSGRQWTFSSVIGDGSSRSAGPTVTVATAYFAGPAPVTVAACPASDLAVSAGPAVAGLGHDGFPVLFRNTSPVACTLFGYPGAAALDPAGHQVEQALRQPQGYLGGIPAGQAPPTVTLQPGATASAPVESTDNPTDTAISCPTYRSFLVTPPDTRTPATVSTPLVVCTPLAVHPVVPGTTGSESRT